MSHRGRVDCCENASAESDARYRQPDPPAAGESPEIGVPRGLAWFAIDKSVNLDLHQKL